MTVPLSEPLVDGETEPFWTAVQERRLVLPWCEDCAAPFFYPRSFCPRCWSERIRYEEAAGRGSVHTFTVIRRGAPPPYDALVSYVLAVIELVEGVRMLSIVVDADLDRVAIGAPVTVDFRAPAGEGALLPVFVLDPVEG
jgi:uncharacterized OB-fold protein